MNVEHVGIFGIFTQLIEIEVSPVYILLHIANIFHEKNEKREYSIIWLNCITHLRNKCILPCSNYWCISKIAGMPACIRINLKHVAKAFCKFGVLSIRFGPNDGVKRSHILCNVLSNEGKKPAWSEHKVQKLNIDTCNRCASRILSQWCYHISSRCFPIKRIPSFERRIKLL